VALPKSLANPEFNYKDNPYYIEGEYDGERCRLFLSHFLPLLNRVSFFEADGAVVKSGSTPKPNQQYKV